MTAPTQHKFPWSHLTPPFRYFSSGEQILDSDNHLVADIRGWGYLTSVCGLQMSDAEACKVQDRFGEWIAQAMTDCAVAERDGDNMQNTSPEPATPYDRLVAEIERLRSIGTVFIPPSDWDYFGMGGGPSIDDFEQIDLTSY